MKKSKLRYVLSPKNIKRLLADKLKRTTNFNSKLYKCKIFKKCKKKRKNLCKNKKKCKNNSKITKKKTEINNLFRGFGLLKNFD